MKIHDCDKCRYETTEYMKREGESAKRFDIYSCGDYLKLRFSDDAGLYILTRLWTLKSNLEGLGIVKFDEHTQNIIKHIAAKRLEEGSNVKYWAIRVSWGEGEDSDSYIDDVIFTDRNEAEKYRLYLANRRNIYKYPDNEDTEFTVEPMRDANKVDLYKEEGE